MKGSVFVQQLNDLPRIPDRENAVVEAVRGGLAVAWPLIDVAVQTSEGPLVVRVAADYFAIGEADDFVRIPLSPLAAQRICDLYGAMLPTTRLSQLIWEGANVRLSPQPMGAPYDATMLSVARFVEHNGRIETQRAGRGGLVAGHKKDVVISQRLVAQPSRVAIYGWQQASGVPIQPLSLVHENTYADYSHGVRLISKTAYLAGAAVSLESILTSEKLASCLSSEGPLGIVRVPGVPAPGVPTRDDGPLGVRAVAVAEAELARPGWESPPGSHAGPRIAQYFAGCQRGGQPLRLASGNWCAAFASFCAGRATLQGDEPPHGYRAAVAELWADALQGGAARRMSTGYRPAIGDLALFARAGEDPTRGGRGHVGRVTREVDAAGTYETIEGNHENVVARVTRTLTETVGFIAYPRTEQGSVTPTDEDLQEGSDVLGNPPSDDVPEETTGPARLPPDKTNVTEMALYAALERGWTALWSERPHRTSVLVLLAHWALETGRGKAMVANNLGNIKSREGDGHDYTYFACNEVIQGKTVWFYPDHPACRFRAYKTLDLGVADYLTLLRKRFEAAWPAVLAGSPADFCHLLKVHGYYTANEVTYTAAVVSLYNEYARLLTTGVDLGSVLSVQRALATLGYDPGPLNGQPGPRYRAAVESFQEDRGLEVDGVVGPNTRGALAAALAALDEVSAPRLLAPTREVELAFGAGLETETETLMSGGPPDHLVLIDEPARPSL